MRKLLSALMIAMVSIFLFQSCSNSSSNSEQKAAIGKEDLVKEIKLLEDTLKTNESKQINLELAKSLIEKSKTYAENFPEDDLSPAYLFRAGNISVGIGSFQEAIALFEAVHQKYGDYDRTPDALFLEGFTYENHLNDIENAKKCYDEFLKRFPDNQLADQVRVVLQNLGKSPEELVKGFQKK